MWEEKSLFSHCREEIGLGCIVVVAQVLMFLGMACIDNVGDSFRVYGKQLIRI